MTTTGADNAWMKSLEDDDDAPNLEIPFAPDEDIEQRDALSFMSTFMKIIALWTERKQQQRAVVRRSMRKI
jgi:hypothetical protein